MCICSLLEGFLHNSLLGALEVLEVLLHRADLEHQAPHHNLPCLDFPRKQRKMLIHLFENHFYSFCTQTDI